MPRGTSPQGTLFELPPPQRVAAAERRPEHVELAARLPEGLRMAREIVKARASG